MKKTVKKPSTKIVVDEFDKYYRRDHEDRVKKSTYNQKQSNYQRFIEQELPQKQTKHEQKFYYQPYKKEQLRESIYKKTNPDLKHKVQQKINDFMSDDSEEIYNITGQTKRERNEQSKKQANRQKEALKNSQNLYFNESRRDYDYYPQNAEKKQRKETQKMQKEKRPTSAMNKKQQVNKKVEKSKKQIQAVIKKTLSSSKFKEQHKLNHSSQHKQTKSRNRDTFQHLKINSIPQKQITNQYRELINSNLKKKTVINKPLKIEEIHKVYSHHDSSKKLNSSQLVQKMRYPKQEQKVQIKPKKSLKIQKQQEEKPIFFKNRHVRERQHLQNSQIIESEFKPRQKRFQQQQQKQIPIQQERERIYSRRRRPPVTESQPQRRQQLPSQIRNQRQQRRQREQPRPQPSRNQNQRRQNQQRQPRRQGGEPGRQQQTRNNRNPRYQSSTSRQQNPQNIFRLVSQTINGQLQFINNQFNMMSNIFENISNFVNINIDAHPNYYFGEYGQYSHSNMSSSGFDSDSSESVSSDYDYYQNEQEPQGMDEQELQMINKLKYKVTEHGNNQCTICLIELKNGDEAKKLFCQHIFHSQCIDEWLRRKSACPVCRDKQ